MTDFERQLLADTQKTKSWHKVLVSLIWALALVLVFTIGTVAYYTYDYITSLVVEYEYEDVVEEIYSETTGNGDAMVISGNQNNLNNKVVNGGESRNQTQNTQDKKDSQSN